MQRYTRDDDAIEGMRPDPHGPWCEWSPLLDAAADLRAACKAIFSTNKPEAMRLFALYRQIVTELHRRANPVVACRWN